MPAKPEEAKPDSEDANSMSLAKPKKCSRKKNKPAPVPLGGTAGLEVRCPNAVETGLAEEIRMLRRMAHRLVEFAEGVESLDEAVTALNAFGCAAVRLSRLMKEQHDLSMDNDEVKEAISIALREMRREFGLENTI